MSLLLDKPDLLNLVEYLMKNDGFYRIYPLIPKEVQNDFIMRFFRENEFKMQDIMDNGYFDFVPLYREYIIEKKKNEALSSMQKYLEHMTNVELRYNITLKLLKKIVNTRNINFLNFVMDEKYGEIIETYLYSTNDNEVINKINEEMVNYIVYEMDNLFFSHIMMKLVKSHKIFKNKYDTVRGTYYMKTHPIIERIIEGMVIEKMNIVFDCVLKYSENLIVDTYNNNTLNDIHSNYQFVDERKSYLNDFMSLFVKTENEVMIKFLIYKIDMKLKEIFESCTLKNLVDRYKIVLSGRSKTKYFNKLLDMELIIKLNYYTGNVDILKFLQKYFGIEYEYVDDIIKEIKVIDLNKRELNEKKEEREKYIIFVNSMTNNEN